MAKLMGRAIKVVGKKFHKKDEKLFTRSSSILCPFQKDFFVRKRFPLVGLEPRPSMAIVFE